MQNKGTDEKTFKRFKTYFNCKKGWDALQRPTSAKEYFSNADLYTFFRSNAFEFGA